MNLKSGLKILVLGSGGREHALAWVILNGSLKPKVICMPGNAGTGMLCSNIPIGVMEIDKIVIWCVKYKPDLVIVGPEAPLCAGLADKLTAAGIKVFGPNQDAARLEGSKVFSHQFMIDAGISKAKARIFSNASDAIEYAQKQVTTIVVKADGLAAGKGVTVCSTVAEAEKAITDILVKKVFGADAGAFVLIEKCLKGVEASVLALVDGEKFVMLPPAQDHKRRDEKEKGPNTGGMGAYSTDSIITPELSEIIKVEVFGRVMRELKRRGITYKGVLYAGLMITKDGVMVLEFNCRFGDPETQAILVRWDGDILPALFAVADGNLREDYVRWKKEVSICVIMAAGGYPGSYKQGDEITGIAYANEVPGVIIFHAGTKLDADGRILTAGGRVLGVTGVGATVRQAVDRAYEACGRIKFDGAFCRHDIAYQALK